MVENSLGNKMLASFGRFCGLEGRRDEDSERDEDQHVFSPECVVVLKCGWVSEANYSFALQSSAPYLKALGQDGESCKNNLFTFQTPTQLKPPHNNKVYNSYKQLHITFHKYTKFLLVFSLVPTQGFIRKILLFKTAHAKLTPMHTYANQNISRKSFIYYSQLSNTYKTHISCEYNMYTYYKPNGFYSYFNQFPHF